MVSAVTSFGGKDADPWAKWPGHPAGIPHFTCLNPQVSPQRGLLNGPHNQNHKRFLFVVIKYLKIIIQLKLWFRCNQIKVKDQLQGNSSLVRPFQSVNPCKLFVAITFSGEKHS